MRSTGRTAGAIAGFTALAATITVTILAVGSSEPAGAAELEKFASCAELEAWSDDTATDLAKSGPPMMFDEASGGAATTGAPTAAPIAEADAGRDGAQSTNLASTGSGTGGTNTVVEGVDEIDVLDRVDENRVVILRNGALSLVDLTKLAVVDSVIGVPFDARVSVDGSLVWIAGSAPDGSGVDIRRMRIEADKFVADGDWTTPGYLLEARRTGDLLHVVAVDYGNDGSGAIPFEGGPVPCEQVWRPVDPSTTPAATLVASLPSTGALEPVAATEVTGAAGNLLVTDDSVYIATETYSETAGQSAVSTGLHRFDIDTLTPSGSGAVPGTLAGPFAINEYEGNLRVATSLTSFGRFIEGDAVLVDEVGAPAVRGVAPESQPSTPESLAEVFVLDTAGDLDIVGRTGLFGHDRETIQGVRFVEDVAYVVTFLQTDPFWVIDLSSPSTPAVVGELEIPGFSAYLHPLGDGRVVGFGPDGNGQVAARLFDVSDPTKPTVLDERALANDSTVVWDYHAFVALEDGRFAVPITDWPVVADNGCVEPPVPAPLPIEPGIGDGSSSSGVSADFAAPCQPTFTGGSTGVAVLGIEDGRMPRPEKFTVPTDGSIGAERAIQAPDGSWLLLSFDRLVPTDGGEALVLPADPATGAVPVEG